MDAFFSCSFPVTLVSRILLRLNNLECRPNSALKVNLRLCAGGLLLYPALHGSQAQHKSAQLIFKDP